ncbi:MAG: transcription antitermination factor NusB [Actinobacteria bacterium HGW-Actinobacteria-2]|nr:MAG: transcription antitermination factor NusB [Actinobacteria bacterium HGW-Actinobacteria-2]
MTEPETTKRGSTRTKARKRALDILFEADLRAMPIDEILAAHVAENTPPVRDFTVSLVEGVAAETDTLDALISDALATGWTLSRMPRVDRNLARLALWEMRASEIDSAIIIAEYVSLADGLSTDDSATFLNGVLGRLGAGR